MFKILSIDGGGFRGVYSAHILKRIEETYNVKWTEDFDMIAGTSTGSIIAAGLVTGKKADEITKLYKKLGETVFSKKWMCRLSCIPKLFMSPYDANPLKKELDNVFEEKTLGNYSFPLLIPSTDIGNNYVHIFKSNYDTNFVRDKNVKLSDAILASCSAPTYFDPHKTNNYLLADGGLWANSPAIIAAIEAKYRLNKKFDELRILSIGTCGDRSFYSMQKNCWNKLLGWGILTRWKHSRLIDMILNLQVQSANNMLGLLLDKSHILRIDGKSNIPLDAPSMFDDLVTRADKDFTYESQKIQSFLQEK